MANLTSSADFLTLVQKSGVVSPDILKPQLDELRASSHFLAGAEDLARVLVDRGVLTYFQAHQLLAGKWRGFTVGKYLILERIGSGGMGVVYLAEHRLLHRRVAIKVLPISLAQDAMLLDFFYREAQAVAALNHPNVVRAHDVGQDGNLHFLVMEYVDGNSFQTIVGKVGRLAPARVANYIRQAARGLQHAHEVGLVHRDIKPANFLLDRQGTVKLLDLGLAQFTRNSQKLLSAKNGPRYIVGTDDYLAPEQIVDSDSVDIRADIYSLGATAYYLLTGKPPFEDTGEKHRLMAHLLRRPRPLPELQPELDKGFVAIIDRMMAKNPWERFQTPASVDEALKPWTRTPVPPPPAAEMPDLSPAARRLGGVDGKPSSSRRPAGQSSWVIYNQSAAEGGSHSGLLSGLTKTEPETRPPAASSTPAPSHATMPSHSPDNAA